MRMNRRQFVASGLTAALWASVPSRLLAEAGKPPLAGAGKTQCLPWSNWSGYLKSNPAQRIAPHNVDHMASVLKSATLPIRPVGSSHSFAPLVPTDGTLISLRQFSEVKVLDAAQKTASAGAGVRLGVLGEALHQIDQALPNMPDIDEQTLGGSIGTATHGTGIEYGAIHAYLKGLQLVTPAGEVLECSASENTDVFDAARVSMGSLGVITRFDLQNVAPYKLRRKTWVMPLDELLADVDALVAENRNFEFYYIPYSDYALVITTNETDAPLSPRTEDPDTEGLEQLKLARDWLGWSEGLRRWVINFAMKDTPVEDNIDWAYRIYPSERSVRFNEMEYHLPREALAEALQRVRRTIEDNNLPIFFPIEARVVQGDDAWLSPFYKRDTCSIAVHRHYVDDPLDYFAQIEPIYQDYEGRPHWGKMNTLDQKTLASRYPRWQDFKAIRESLDPQGRLLNSYLKGVLAS